MIGCLQTRVRKQPIIVLYFEFETLLMFYNLEASSIQTKELGKSYNSSFNLSRMMNNKTNQTFNRNCH